MGNCVHKATHITDILEKCVGSPHELNHLPTSENADPCNLEPGFPIICKGESELTGDEMRVGLFLRHTEEGVVNQLPILYWTLHPVCAALIDMGIPLLCEPENGLVNCAESLVHEWLLSVVQNELWVLQVAHYLFLRGAWLGQIINV